MTKINRDYDAHDLILARDRIKELEADSLSQSEQICNLMRDISLLRAGAVRLVVVLKDERRSDEVGASHVPF